MSLLSDFLKSVLDREEVQKAAASLLIDFFQPKLPPKDVIDVEAKVKGEKKELRSTGDESS